MIPRLIITHPVHQFPVRDTVSHALRWCLCNRINLKKGNPPLFLERNLEGKLWRTLNLRCGRWCRDAEGAECGGHAEDPWTAGCISRGRYFGISLLLSCRWTLLWRDAEYSVQEGDMYSHSTYRRTTIFLTSIIYLQEVKTPSHPSHSY